MSTEPKEKDEKKKAKEIFINIDKIEKLVGDMVDEISKEKIKGVQKGKKPLVFGFSVKINPKGEMEIEELETTKEVGEKLKTTSYYGPLVDVQELENETIITADMPGLKIQEIAVKAGPNFVLIRSRNPKRPFFKKIDLKNPIVAKKAYGKFKNGILEISFQRLKQIENSSTSIS